MGASAHLNKFGALRRKRKIFEFEGYFEPNGTSDPTVISCPGVKSVKYAATGKYTVTMDDTWVDVSVGQPCVQLHALADVFCQVSDIDPVASGGATILLLLAKLSDHTATTIANSAGKAGNRIHLRITCAGGSDFSKNT